MRTLRTRKVVRTFLVRTFLVAPERPAVGKQVVSRDVKEIKGGR